MSKIDYQALREAAEKAGEDKWQAKKINGDFFVIRHGSYTRQHGYTSYQPIAEIDCKPVRDFVAKANPATVLALLDELEAAEKRIAELESLTAPRLTQQAVPDEMPEPDTTRMFFTDAVVAIAKAQGWNACRAAMLHGAEPVSEHDELPLDYLQGHKDGLEWAAQLAEANHPQTGDWLYDDPIDLARAIRKGPDMPTVQAGNSPVTPDGWVMVPKEPTQAMIKAWLSEIANFRGHAAGYRAAIEAAPQLEVNRG